MTGAWAPARVPFAPKPLKDELFSSWLLRVAAANHVSARELLSGFNFQYPDIQLPVCLDSGLDFAFLQAISRFCRVPVRALKLLDLQQRLRHSKHALLLRFGSAPRMSPRYCDLRAGYSFCPLCLVQHANVHVRWDWCIACLVRCSVHNVSLQLGCPCCGEPDPLSFGPPLAGPTLACWSCGSDLTLGTNVPENPQEGGIAAVERAYRDALLGVAPDQSLLGRVTDRQFRSFVDDMLQLLIRSPQQQRVLRNAWKQDAALPPGQPLLALIAGLILNAAPTTDPRVRRTRHRTSLRLWGDILPTLSEGDGEELERSSRMWPIPLRGRFSHALLYYKRRRWPYPLFLSPDRSPGFRYNDRLEFRDLNAANQYLGRDSGI